MSYTSLGYILFVSCCLIFYYIFPDHKKSNLHIPPGKPVKEHWRTGRMWTIIKGEGNLGLFLMLLVYSTCLIGCFYRFIVHSYQFDLSVIDHSPGKQKPCKA